MIENKSSHFISYFSKKQLGLIFANNSLKNDIHEDEERGLIPRAQRVHPHKLERGWKSFDIPLIGERFGFLKKWKGTKIISVFTTKGGVLKSTLAFNMARTFALHNFKTCVVGLDVQGDITNLLTPQYKREEDELEGMSVEELIESMDQTLGLCDYLRDKCEFSSIVHKSNLPTLDYIPETPELTSLGMELEKRKDHRWLKNKIVEKLKTWYDLIIFDCSPNWNVLTTNALLASDVLLSPLECHINNFRNYKLFKSFITEFKKSQDLNLREFYIPTKYSRTKKLIWDIYEWYKNNIDFCTFNGIRDTVYGELANKKRISMLEYVPNHNVSHDLRNLFMELNEYLLQDEFEDSNLNYEIWNQDRNQLVV